MGTNIRVMMHRAQGSRGAEEVSLSFPEVHVVGSQPGRGGRSGTAAMRPCGWGMGQGLPRATGAPEWPEVSRPRRPVVYVWRKVPRLKKENYIFTLNQGYWKELGED